MYFLWYLFLVLDLHMCCYWVLYLNVCHTRVISYTATAGKTVRTTLYRYNLWDFCTTSWITFSVIVVPEFLLTLKVYCRHDFLASKLWYLTLTITVTCKLVYYPSVNVTVTSILSLARIWHSEDCASWYILIMKPTRCTSFSNLFLECWLCCLLASGIRMFHPDPARKQSA